MAVEEPPLDGTNNITDFPANNKTITINAILFI